MPVVLTSDIVKRPYGNFRPDERDEVDDFGSVSDVAIELDDISAIRRLDVRDFTIVLKSGSTVVVSGYGANLRKVHAALQAIWKAHRNAGLISDPLNSI